MIFKARSDGQQRSGLCLLYLDKSLDPTAHRSLKADKKDCEALGGLRSYFCTLWVSLYMLSHPDVSAIPLGATFIMEAIFSPSKWCRDICDNIKKACTIFL